MSGPTKAFVETLMEYGIVGLLKDEVYSCPNCSCILLGQDLIRVKSGLACSSCYWPEESLYMWSRQDIEEFLAKEHVDIVKEYWKEG